MSQAQPVIAHSWHLPRLILAWLITAMFAVMVILFAPLVQRFEWLAVAIATSAVVAFILQLGTAQRVGFITRLSFSVVGSAIIVGLAEGIAFLLGS